MAKNIILCADGTGNQGGSTPDSNVYKVYKAVEKSFQGEVQDGFTVAEQIVFYDNGVGTAKNKYLRALGGAFGFGFEDKVCDLYKFLARNYQPGDRVYFFGFSRGASTVRACNGFISICGLAKGQGLRNRELDVLVHEAFTAYKRNKRQPEKAAALKKSSRSHGVIDIHFLGIWDTVVALGFPKQTDIVGPLSAIFNTFFGLAEKVLDLLWPHNFYYYRLTENVQYAYQALAIDDERTAFWPFVWREEGRSPDTVEQVWFAGMHANVGGGYPRSGMASVPLYWMMVQAQKRGLKLDRDSVKNVREDSHAHGRMYNSRDGFAAFYRYHPREIEKLCQDRIAGDIKLHRSVIERIKHRTANYAPGQLPGRFAVVKSDPEAASELRNPGKDPSWATIRVEIDRWVLRRKGLYAAMMALVMTIIGVTGWFWDDLPVSVVRKGFWGWLTGFLDYITPDFFDRLLNYAVVQHHELFIGAVILVAVYWWLNRRYCFKIEDACERLRHLIIHEEVEKNTQNDVVRN